VQESGAVPRGRRSAFRGRSVEAGREEEVWTEVYTLGDTAREALRTIAARLGAAATRELAGALDLTHSEVTEALIELEEHGLVEPVLWRVTAEGRALVHGEAR